MFEKLVRIFLRIHSFVILKPSLLQQGLTKTIPGSPEGRTPVHEIAKPVFKALQK